MRMTEFKSSEQLNEKLADYVGNYGAAALKQFGNRFLGRLGGDGAEGELSVSDKAHKETFINNFISSAYKSLNSEIASGRVDPNIKSQPTTQPAQPPQAEPPAQPAQPAASAAPAPAASTPRQKLAAPGQAQRQTNQNINNYVQSLAKTLNAEPDKAKKMALAKELVNFMADRKDYPEWANALKTAEYVIKKGVPDPNFSNSAINRLKAGQMMEAWQVYWINKLLESIGFTFKDMGLTLLQENSKNKNYILVETKFYKLNNLFEEILNEAESIEQWLKRWLPAYLKFKLDDTHSQSLIKAAGDSYDAKDRRPFNAALTKIANAAFTAAQAPGFPSGDQQPQSDVGQPARVAGAQPTAEPAAAPAKTGTNTDTIINSLQSLLAKLKGIDPALHSTIIKKIGAGESLQGLPGKVSESKQKIKK